MQATTHCEKSLRWAGNFMLGCEGYGWTTVRYLAPSSVTGIGGRLRMTQTRFYALSDTAGSDGEGEREGEWALVVD